MSEGGGLKDDDFGNGMSFGCKLVIVILGVVALVFGFTSIVLDIELNQFKCIIGGAILMSVKLS